MRFFMFLAAVACTLTLAAQPTLRFTQLPNTTGNTFNDPVDITGAGDGSGRLFVVERRGTIRVYDRNTQSVDPGFFLDLRGMGVNAGGEKGLLGLTFDPDFATNGYFYVNYTRNNLFTSISRFTATPGATTVDFSTRVELLSLSQFAGNHNAGDLAFGPDGYLYIPTGDGGGSGDPEDNAQDPTSLLGKLLRIDVSGVTSTQGYTIPPDNPFVANGDGVRDEIFALGLRNPWRIGFDRVTNELYIADVGQGNREEVNRIPAGGTGGQNFGWDCREGFANYNDNNGSPLCVAGSVYTEPLFDYDHSSSNGGLSITGGFVYRGTTARDLEGYYVCADYLTNRFFLFPPDGVDNADVIRQTPGGIANVSTFGEADNGDLFLASLSSNLIYEVGTTLALPIDLSAWSGTARKDDIQLNWEVATQENVETYAVERLGPRGEFVEIARVPATSANVYNTVDAAPALGTNTYRLNALDLDGSNQYSDVINVNFGTDVGQLTIFPNPNTGNFQLTGFDATDNAVLDVSVTVLNAEGRVVAERAASQRRGRIELGDLVLPDGMYQILAQQGGLRFVGKLVVKN